VSAIVAAERGVAVHLIARSHFAAPWLDRLAHSPSATIKIPATKITLITARRQKKRGLRGACQ
jgi:hypothetical protein